MRRTALPLVLVLAACGGPGDEAPDASVDAGDTDEPLDLDRAQWIHSPVYSDSSTFASSADLAISPSGEQVVAWAEDIGETLIETQIFVAEGGPSFDARSIMASAGNSFTRPSIHATADAVHLVAAARTGSTNTDVFYARRQGGAWGPVVNLTGPADVMAFTDHDPEVLATATETIVLFRSQVFNTMTLENNGVYMLRFSDPQTPGPVIPILDRASFDCNDFEALLDDDDKLHIVANCSEDDGDREVLYVTNKSGTFTTRGVTAPNATFPLSPDIALSNGGDSVHLIWNASTDCGGITCRDLFYSRDLGPPVSVSGGEEDGGFIPQIAVDSANRVIVAFHRLGDVDDVMWSYSATSTAFVRLQLATPGTPDSVDSSVGNLVIDPVTDRPHMVYIHSLPGPGGSNIFHGELVR